MTCTLRMLCEGALEFVIRHGLVPPYTPTGRLPGRPSRRSPLLRREEERAVWYASREGALYQDREQWRRAYQIVHSFTKQGRSGSCFRLPRLWGRVAAPVGAVLDQLPNAFSYQGFECVSRSAVGRSALFRAGESCRVEQLPEPYGKWQQHELLRPRWERPVELQVEARCRLEAVGRAETEIDLELSTFALLLLPGVGCSLSELLALAPPLRCTFEYLKTRTSWLLAGELIDLRRLS